MKARESLAIMIDAAMRRRDVSRSELARRLGRSRSQVTQMLSGKQNLTIDTIENIFKAMSVGVALELDFKDSPSPSPAMEERNEEKKG